jgi:hypothetical protein
MLHTVLCIHQIQSFYYQLHGLNFNYLQLHMAAVGSAEGEYRNLTDNILKLSSLCIFSIRVLNLLYQPYAHYSTHMNIKDVALTCYHRHLVLNLGYCAP